MCAVQLLARRFVWRRKMLISRRLMRDATAAAAVETTSTAADVIPPGRPTRFQSYTCI